MKILLVGATGTIGAAVPQTLETRHQILRSSRSHSPFTVDLADPDSIRRLYAKVGRVNAVVCAAGQAIFRPLLDLSDADFALGLANKLMGQVNMVRLGIEALADKGSFTLTSGILSRQPMPGGVAISIVNAGIEGFARAAALELPRGLRIKRCRSWLGHRNACCLEDGSQHRHTGHAGRAILHEGGRRQHDRPDSRCLSRGCLTGPRFRRQRDG